MTKASETGGAMTAREIRRARARKLAIRFGVWVVVPTLLGIIYYGCWATPQYESVAVFTVQAGGRVGGGPEGLAARSSEPDTRRDAALVREYIRSRAMLDLLVREHGLIEHYQNPDADMWSRLSKDASLEEVYEHYLDKVRVSGGGRASLLTLTVRAYTAAAAQEFSRAILSAAVEMLNEMLEKGRRERLRSAEEEVKVAQARLAKARDALLEFPGDGEDPDSAGSANAVVGVRSALEAELARARADLDAAVAVAGGNAPKVVSLRKRVSAIEGQIALLGRCLVNGGDESVKAAVARFEPALLEKELAQKSFEIALETVELARSEAVGQQRYLVTISEPSLPDKPTLPRRAWGIATVFVLALVLMGVFTLLAAAVREHAKL